MCPCELRAGKETVASQPSLLVSSRPLRDPAVENKVDNSRGTDGEDTATDRIDAIKD